MLGLVQSKLGFSSVYTCKSNVVFSNFLGYGVAKAENRRGKTAGRSKEFRGSSNVNS